MAMKEGTLEHILLTKMVEKNEPVCFLDFVGTGITKENIDQIVNNLQNGLYETDDFSQQMYVAQEKAKKNPRAANLATRRF
jgi:hypothetical protein